MNLTAVLLWIDEKVLMLHKPAVTMKHFLVLVAILLVMSNCPAGEDQSYRVFFVITSESDWTILRLVSGGQITSMVYEMTCSAPECECWCDTHENVIGMTKPPYDTTVATIEVTAILYIGDADLMFEIQKGDIEYTTVEVYSYNRKLCLVETVTQKENVPGDPENCMEFSIKADNLKTDGPLALLTSSVPKLVWAFYYPWYYKDQWTSEILTDNPIHGPQDSSDPDVIEMHIKQARSAGIDGFIVSWWGEHDYTDQNLKAILDVADEYDFNIAIYFESLLDGPRSEGDLTHMLLSFFNTYYHDERYYHIHGEPVIFVWAVDSQPPSVWERVITHVEQRGYIAVYIANTTQPEYLGVFEGLHVYGTVGISDLAQCYERLSHTCRTYGYLYDETPYLWAAAICPGYDDRNIPGRSGLYQPRENGTYYQATFEAAVKSSPDWILITSFNEWWEHTHIEPSVLYGSTYLGLTAQYSSQFKGEPLELPAHDEAEEQSTEEIQSEQREAGVSHVLVLLGLVYTTVWRRSINKPAD